MTIKFLEPAQKELDEAYIYYDSKEKGLGSIFMDEIYWALKNIKAYPMAWPDFSDRTRRCLLPTFPYSIIYRIRDNEILVIAIAIAQSHREPDYWNTRLK